VPQGWLAVLREAAHEGERTVCALAVPADLRQGQGQGQGQGIDIGIDLDEAVLALAGLPRTTPVPAGAPPCLYLRGDLLGAVGPLDPGLDPPGAWPARALLDWMMRAQALGLLTVRANRAPVLPPRSFSAQRVDDFVTPELARRHPHLAAQLGRHAASLEARLCEHALRCHLRRRVRVALDLRHLHQSQVGTSVYGVQLARALARRPDVELSLLVREQEQARAAGLDGQIDTRIVLPHHAPPDVEVVHKPVQLYDPQEVAQLFATPAHLVITHQDLIAHHAQAALPDQGSADRYRTLSYLALHAAQRIIAISSAVQREIAQEFGLPAAEIPVIHQAVDADEISRPRPRPAEAPPGPYFLAVGSDYPHKGVPLLLRAYARLRAAGAAPELVLVGGESGARGGAYADLREQAPPGVRWLRRVPLESLWGLYQHALAVVFPSVYEGFGLPPLEAMAAGVPAIAFALSAMPEVCGEAARYPAGLSEEALCAAMADLAGDAGLRARLVAAGRERVGRFSQERRAEETVAAYRDAVLRPSPRSLLARRYLLDVLPPPPRGDGESERLLRWAQAQALYHPRLFRVAAAPAFALYRAAEVLRRLRG
jgi:glycosyltransferase involved in cell wall biosynthesis